jgi:hypothetical protein
VHGPEILGAKRLDFLGRRDLSQILLGATRRRYVTIETYNLISIPRSRMVCSHDA